MSTRERGRPARFSIIFAAVVLPSFLVLTVAPALAQTGGDSQASAAGDAGQAASSETIVSPGPGESQRKALLARIMEAKAKGIGITNYMMAFQALDQSVKSGDASADILKRVDSLNVSLDEQFKRSAVLKVQKLPPPVAASPQTSPLGAIAGGGSKGSGDTMKDLQAKYGDKIPPELKDKLGSDPSKLMDMLKNLKK
jgi:hypothetical protein